MTFFKSIKKTMLIVSTMYIVVGVYLLIYKETQINICLLIISAGLLVSGILCMVRYFLINVKDRIKRKDFLVGILLLVIAFVVYISLDVMKNQNLSKSIFGTMLCVSGLMKIQDLFDCMATGKKIFAYYFFGFIICVALGLIVMFSPFVSISFLYILIGIGLLFCGITDIVSNFIIAMGIFLLDKESSNEQKVELKEKSIASDIVYDNTEIDKDLILENNDKNFTK